MTQQRLSTIVNIGGGLTGAFRRSVQGGVQDLGSMSSRIRQASATARSLQQQIDAGELGRDGIAAASRAARRYDETLEDLRAQHGVLERQLERGELGRAEANRARGAMEGLEAQMRETEEAAGRLRSEMEDADLGRRWVAAERAARQYDETLNGLRSRHSALESELERGDLGLAEANSARRTMQGLEAQMRETEGAARRLRSQMEEAELGRDRIAAAGRSVRQYEATLKDLRSQHGTLETQLERGDLGRREAIWARRTMQGLEAQMRETGEAADGIRRSIERGELGRETVAALRREVERLNGEVDETSAGINRSGRAGRLGWGQVAAGAAVVTGAVAAVGFAVNGTVEELQELRQLQFRAGLVDTQGLQRAGLAFQQLGVDAREGADFYAEAVSEIRLRLGELAAEGKQSQLEIAQGLGVDLSALANLGDEDLILAQFEHVRRVYREQGADVARALTESFQGGVEAQRLASIAALPQAEYEAFIATLREGSTTSEETFRGIQRLGVGFGTAGLQVERIKRSVVAGLTPALGGLLDRVIPIIDATANWLEENKTIAAIIGGVLLGGIVALTVAVGLASVAVLAGLVPAGVALVIAWSPVIAIVLAVIAVVGGLVAAGVLLYRNWGQVVYEFRQGWDDLKIMALQGADFLLAQIERILNAAGPLLSVGEKIAGFFGADVDVRGGVASARAGIAGEIAQTREAQQQRAQVRAEETLRTARERDQEGDSRGGLLGALPGPVAAGGTTIIEGDTIVQSEVNVTQNETEDVDTTYARVNQLNLDQADALAAAAGSR